MPVSFLIEANQQRFPFAQARRTQFTRRTEKIAQQGFIIGGCGLHIKSDDVLSLGNHDSMGRLRQQQHLLRSACCLAGVGMIRHPHGILLKEPLSPLAAHSTLAMIKPVYRTGHGTCPPPLIMMFGEIVCQAKGAAQGIDAAVAFIGAGIGNMQVAAFDVQ